MNENQFLCSNLVTAVNIPSLFTDHRSWRTKLTIKGNFTRLRVFFSVISEQMSCLIGYEKLKNNTLFNLLNASLYLYCFQKFLDVSSLSNSTNATSFFFENANVLFMLCTTFYFSCLQNVFLEAGGQNITQNKFDLRRPVYLCETQSVTFIN